MIKNNTRFRDNILILREHPVHESHLDTQSCTQLRTVKWNDACFVDAPEWNFDEMMLRNRGCRVSVFGH